MIRVIEKKPRALRSQVKQLENALIDAEAAIVTAREAVQAGRASEAHEILHHADVFLRVFLDCWRGEGLFSAEEVADRRAVFDSVIASVAGGRR